ncbi:penicillinase repressor family protein [Asticcacaulis biprosthecium C19]|uniref:Penicillinase repressor family protein n=1 Tax=Asticcacaulis biprosthecium C19 TaxID=715226 RepID=F4QQP9_9CAUL|nr:BlaI/MecI/CopY family transcriptional regulator [Asticcacaulis biprosthecium]EGF90536.1 penicillinase repressor family protein [Asticcacaulis biprosthecium C19]
MLRPTDFELKLLRPLWRRGRLSARELHEASAAETEWSYSATRKTLDRMVEKGMIRVEPVHGLNTYVALQSKLQTVAALASAFARDVLETDAPLPAAAFVHSKLVSHDEIAELEALLAQMSGPDGKDQ